MSTHAVATTILYSRPGCQGCRMSKRLLERLGVAFQTLDVDEDPAALAQVQALGYTSLPVVVAGDQHWAGYLPERLQSLAGN